MKKSWTDWCIYKSEEIRLKCMREHRVLTECSQTERARQVCTEEEKGSVRYAKSAVLAQDHSLTACRRAQGREEEAVMRRGRPLPAETP